MRGLEPDCSEADRLFFDQIEAEFMEDETLQKQAKVNRLVYFQISI